MHDLSGQTLAWHQAIVRTTIARHDIKPISSRLRTVFPAFAEHEVGPDDNLRMWVGIAGAFRHCIVHSRARIPKSEVTSFLERASGESFTGKKEDVCMRRAMIGKYLHYLEGVYHIQGIDRRQLKPSYAFVNKPTTDLMVKLASHACLAYSTALLHFGGQPFWE